MKVSISKQMNAIFLKDETGQLEVRQVPVPLPGPGEVLIKMKAAPVNPSDLARIKSMVNNSEFSLFIPGIEGSGLVVDHGKGILPKLWVGKRVACTSTHVTSGTWGRLYGYICYEMLSNI